MDGGLIHIYCGNGKGKTTAATGLAVRAAGSGAKVLFTQFFKDGTSSEIRSLRQLKNIELLLEERYFGRYGNMTEVQKSECVRVYRDLFGRAVKAAAEQKADLLVLDEAVSACNLGVLDEREVISFLKNKPSALEVVLTGREPSEALLETADYVSRIQCEKHPFERGICARKGIEY